MSKQFQIGRRPPHARLSELPGRWAERAKRCWRHHQTTRARDEAAFQALSDVSFEVQRGEVMGIIGANGAGKSTLLKILSRITRPTAGRVRMRGRVGALLEVGTGFHPELTGRENVYLNGAILGMTRTEVDRKFDAIVDFSGVEEFLDTAVKHYSSGMHVRLAFAIAAHLDPEILLIDEVLAVGDAAFRKKCVAQMGSVARDGRTVIVVSHDMQTVASLCGRSCLLSAGRAVYVGHTSDAINTYLEQNKSSDVEYQAEASNREPKITYVGLTTSAPGNTQHHGEAMEVRLTLSTPVPVEGAAVSFDVCDSLGQSITHLWSYDSERQPVCHAPGTYTLVCRIPHVRLYLGHYTLTVDFGESSRGRHFEHLTGLCPFEVVTLKYREYPWPANAFSYLEDAQWNVMPPLQLKQPAREEGA